jgi:hypothetical protein
MNEVRVEVRDRGGGVEDVERIFEPFFTTKENGMGMGMGLAICRSIIEAHDGRLRATKTSPAGQRSTLTLPAYSSESQLRHVPARANLFDAFAIPSGAARAASNHEEPMGGIAPELFDQARFPIEIGLHRTRCDIGALVGAPVAV